MKKLLAILVAASFAVISAGSFGAQHTGAQPAKDGKKDEMKKESAKKAEPKKETAKKAEPKKEEAKKAEPKKEETKK